MTNETALNSARTSELTTLQSKSHWIASCPGTAWWGGEYAVLRGGLAVCQPIPLRVYVGVEICPGATSEHPIVIEHSDTDGKAHLAWDWDGRTQTHAFRPYKPLQLELSIPPRRKLVYETLERIYTCSDCHDILKIRTLSELIPGSGTNWSGAFSAALTAAVLAAAGRLTPGDITNWQQVQTQNLRTKRGTFQTCFQQAWKLESAINGRLTSGYGPFCSLVGGTHPLLFLRGGVTLPPGQGTINQEQLDALDKVPYWGSTIPECCGQERNVAPLDLYYGILHTGVAKRPTSESVTAASADFPSRVDLVAMRDDLFQLQSLPWLDRSRILSAERLGTPEDVSPGDKGAVGFHQTLDQLQDMAVVLAASLSSAYRSHKMADADNAIRAMRRINDSLEALQRDWPECREIIGRFYGKLNQFEKGVDDPGHNPVYRRSAIKISGSGSGGSLFLVTSTHDGVASTLQELVDEEIRRLPGMDSACLQWFSGHTRNGSDTPATVLEISPGLVLEEHKPPEPVPPRPLSLRELFAKIEPFLHVGICLSNYYIDDTRYVRSPDQANPFTDVYECLLDLLAEHKSKSADPGTPVSVQPDTLLVYGPAGSGKSTFLDAAGNALKQRFGIQYIRRQLNAIHNELDLQAILDEDTRDDCWRVFCVDEVNTGTEKEWAPFSYVADLCNPPNAREHPLIVILAGSGGGSKLGLKELIYSSKFSGRDLGRRIGDDMFDLPVMGPLDCLLAIASLVVGRTGARITKVQVRALLFLLSEAVKDDFTGLQRVREALEKSLMAPALVNHRRLKFIDLRLGFQAGICDDFFVRVEKESLPNMEDFVEIRELC
jgi:hypothetical protein